LPAVTLFQHALQRSTLLLISDEAMMTRLVAVKQRGNLNLFFSGLNL
jgi:hypothetical protein